MHFTTTTPFLHLKVGRAIQIGGLVSTQILKKINQNKKSIKNKKVSMLTFLFLINAKDYCLSFGSFTAIIFSWPEAVLPSITMLPFIVFNTETAPCAE